MIMVVLVGVYALKGQEFGLMQLLPRRQTSFSEQHGDMDLCSASGRRYIALHYAPLIGLVNFSGASSIPHNGATLAFNGLKLAERCLAGEIRLSHLEAAS